ncbi:MAG: SHOCT domain-containing protein [Ilumatobacteraceae bacterium]|nr:SHOCT domain-containing protein [Ilumatobacteraceae bacterium]
MGLFGRKQRKQARPESAVAAEPSPAPPSPLDQPPPAPDPVKELARLESMRDRGELTRDEFDIEKRKVQASQSFRRI